MITLLIAALVTIAVLFTLFSGYIWYRCIEGATKRPPQAFWPRWFYFFRAWSLALGTIELTLLQIATFALIFISVGGCLALILYGFTLDEDQKNAAASIGMSIGVLFATIPVLILFMAAIAPSSQALAAMQVAEPEATQEEITSPIAALPLPVSVTPDKRFRHQGVLAAIKLPAQNLEPKAFAPYGEIIRRRASSVETVLEDPKLTLNGTPRLWIMDLKKRGLVFADMARHRRVTQCLGSMLGKEWFIGVAPPNDLADGTRPELDRIAAFRIPGDCVIKLHVGTWHAGPHFVHEECLFFNLENIDTNERDFDTSELPNEYQIQV
jgi:ureidoglycolate hydrolase